MKATIYHKVGEGMFFEADEPKVSLDNYEEVGTYENHWNGQNVEPFLDHVFEKSNNINFHWSVNEGVTAKPDARSTSVGDLIKVDGLDTWEVSSVGFRKVEVI